MKLNNKIKFLAAGIFVLAVIGLPVLLSINQTRQELRGRAAASTTLYFTPSASASAPLEAKIGDTIVLDLWINPGTNLPSLVKLDLNFDPTKLYVAPTGFLTNLAAFPTTLEGPVFTNGNMKLSLSIGSDSTKAIQKITKVGTLTLTALAPTDVPSSISFGSETLVLSIGSTDFANENILATTEPAFINILPPVTPTPGPTTLNVTAFLHGIGGSGDNANPNDSRLSNKAPQHLQRIATAFIFNSQNELVSSSEGTLTYDPEQGNFKGTITTLNTISQGVYTVKIQIPVHLRRLVPGIQTLIPGQNNILQDITLVAGDIIGDNVLNILDYSILIDCYSDLLPPKACTETNKLLADLNDDGFVNQVDYNLFLREITVQNGD